MFTKPPSPVAVPNIERELARLWLTAGEAKPDGDKCITDVDNRQGLNQLGTEKCWKNGK